MTATINCYIEDKKSSSQRKISLSSEKHQLIVLREHLTDFHDPHRVTHYIRRELFMTDPKIRTPTHIKNRH